MILRTCESRGSQVDLPVTVLRYATNSRQEHDLSALRYLVCRDLIRSSDNHPIQSRSSSRILTVRAAVGVISEIGWIHRYSERKITALSSYLSDLTCSLGPTSGSR